MSASLTCRWFRAAAALLPLWPGLNGQTRPGADEYQAKGAFLLNFARFVEWPATPLRAPLTITVFGRDPFGSWLTQLAEGKSIGDRPVHVRYAAQLQDIKPSDVLFIGASERGRMLDVLRFVGRDSVLTVSDAEEFLDRGGVIQFVMDDNRVRFEVNESAARQAKLRISSRLLGLARRVRE
jgi:hypothetical protein